MVFRTFLIALDNNSTTFISHNEATLVTGKVVIVLDKSEQVAGVKLSFKGTARVGWTEHNGSHRYSHKAQEELFSQVFCLAGDTGGGTGEKVLLTSGEHSFPFCLTLPPNLPSSCKEQDGSIEYTIEAVIRRSWIINTITKRNIDVVAPLEFLASPFLLMPYRFTEEKHFCCLWCRSGPLILTVNIPSRGIAIGREYIVSVEAVNASDYDVRQVVGQITKYTTVRLKPPQWEFQVSQKIISRFDFGALPRKESLSKKVALPPLIEPIINVDTCRIMDIDYYLEVIAESPTCHCNLRISKCVKFGWLPVDHHTATNNQQAHTSDQLGFTNAGFLPDFDDLPLLTPPPALETTSPTSTVLVPTSNTLAVHSTTMQSFLPRLHAFSPTLPAYEPLSGPSALTIDEML